MAVGGGGGGGMTQPSRDEMSWMMASASPRRLIYGRKGERARKRREEGFTKICQRREGGDEVREGRERAFKRTSGWKCLTGVLLMRICVECRSVQPKLSPSSYNPMKTHLWYRMRQMSCFRKGTTRQFHFSSSRRLSSEMDGSHQGLPKQERLVDCFL